MVQCVSVFSGAGGLDIGAAQAGANIIACIENDADSVATLRANAHLGGTEAICTSIEDVSFKRWARGEPTILIGGPPCQPFSKNGYWVRHERRLVERDPRNMLGQYLRATSELEPQAFLFENVESLLHPTNRPTADQFLREAEQMGYRCTVYKANAAAFGVPQKRKRIFIFGMRDRDAEIAMPEPTHSDHSISKSDKRLLPFVGVQQCIADFAGEDYSEPSEDPSQGTYYPELRAVPAGKNYIALSKLEGYSGRTFRPGGRFWNFLNKLHPEHPSITIAAQPGPWVGPFHWSNRRLRVPEIAAIQTFPRDYRFVGSRRSVQRQIGNAVPCRLAKHMVGHLIGHL